MVTIHGASAEDTLSGASQDAVDQEATIARRRSSLTLLGAGDLTLVINGQTIAEEEEEELAMSPVPEEEPQDLSSSRTLSPGLLPRRRGGFFGDVMARRAQEELFKSEGTVPIYADKHGMPETLFPVPPYCSDQKHASHSIVWRYTEQVEGTYVYRLYFYPRGNRIDAMTGRIEGIDLLNEKQRAEVSTSSAFKHTLTVLAKLTKQGWLDYQFDDNGYPIIKVNPKQHSKLVQFQSLVEAVTKLTSMLENSEELLAQVHYLSKQQLAGLVNLFDNVGLLRQVHKDAFKLREVPELEKRVLKAFEKECPNSFAKRQQRLDEKREALDQKFQACIEGSRAVVRGLPGSSAKHESSVSKPLTGAVGSHTVAFS